MDNRWKSLLFNQKWIKVMRKLKSNDLQKRLKMIENSPNDVVKLFTRTVTYQKEKRKKKVFVENEYTEIENKTLRQV
jgi:hypothetical protein